MDWKSKIRQIQELTGCNNSQLESKLGLSNGYINSIITKKNKNPFTLIQALTQKFRINSNWLLTGEGEPFLEDEKAKAESESPQLWLEFEKAVDEITAPRFAKLEKKADETDAKFSDVEKRFSDLERQLERLSEVRLPDEVKGETPAYTAEPEYTEPEETEELPLAVSLAAGLPIEAFDTGDTYPVPKSFLKKNERYCVARICGDSMTELGITNGCYVLVRYASDAISGQVCVVHYGENTTLKKLEQKNDGTWFLKYCDGSGAIIPLLDGDWEVKGVFVRVLRC